MYLLIALALMVTSGGLTLLFCLWPAVSFRSRVGRTVPPAPVRPAPKRRDDYTLAH